MSAIGGPKTTSNGLVFYYDSNNINESYKGEPTTNLIGLWGGAGTEKINSYPSTSNSWGSYHVELYNANTYFTLGTVSVNNNVATSSLQHPFRTYSVVTPNITGGGLTAGTLYFIKKMDSASFTVHTYISTPNIGFNAHVNVLTDNRLSINGTGFPTGFQGPAHIHNSTHVREVIPNGFNGHSYLRVYHFRATDINPLSGSIQHGMAYGVTPAVLSGSTYTLSFYHRASNISSVGRTINVQWYTGVGSQGVSNAVLPQNWSKFSFTFTPLSSSTANLYWTTTDTTNNFAYDISEIQLESSSHATQFTPLSRSLSSSLYDEISSTPLVLVNGGTSSFDLNSNLSFTSSIYISGGNTASLQPPTVTVEAVAQYVGVNQANAFIGGCGDTGANGYWIGVSNSGTNIVFSVAAGTGLSYKQIAVGTASPNTIKHIVGTYTPSQQNLYINGTIAVSDTTVTGSLVYSGITNGFLIGNIQGLTSTRFWSGSIYLFKVYNRVLSPDEILQNFNSMRARFGI